MTAIEPVRRLTHANIQDVRRIRRRSMLLFITDRCPVGCAHCSVDSRADSPTIRDFKLFNEILQWLCSKTELDIVGISGGEPFIERRGLSLASCQLSEAGKRQVIYTSGIWATGKTPKWINPVLARASCIYLSTDSFHARSVTSDRFLRAAHAIATAGAWIVVQVPKYEQMLAQAEKLLCDAFGKEYYQFAELVPTTPLTDGRGSSVFTRTERFLGHSFGQCSAVASPMIRYDGLVTGCCNESVIMSRGPVRLRKLAKSKAEIDSMVESFHADPLLRAFEGAGLGALTQHPRLSDLREQEHTGICDLCWKMLDRFPNHGETDNVINAVAALTSKR